MGADEKVQEHILDLAFRIQDGNFTGKPTYIEILDQEILDPQIKYYLSKISKITKYTLISPIHVYYKQKYEKSKERDKCAICLCELYDDILNEYEKDPSNIEFLQNIPFDVLLLENCEDHFFHVECINNLIGDKNSFKCPVCSKIYGILEGDMPYGTFTVSKTPQRCDGFNCDSIVINYSFPNGQGYTGTHRTCYLPNNKEGREVLALLKVAFDRKLTFTVGTSVTTGRKNTVVWNGIHHKTSMFGGPTCFGYPDKNYFNRVKEELAARGVTKESIKTDLETMAKNLLRE
jgi:deltex-like protein